jgi:tRNA A-37 threonylcarbamoyl transferase component Bud32
MDIELNPTIVVQYKARSSQTGLRTMLALSPFWAIWAPCVTVWLAQAVIVGAMWDDCSMISLTLGFIGLIALAAFTLSVCLRNKFLITANGIRFPVRCLLELGFSLKRDWQEMAQIHFTDSKMMASGDLPVETPDTMVVFFRDGSKLPLELRAFRREDLQNFVLALQSYVPKLAVRPPLAEVKLGIAADNRAQQAVSFTQIWEDDMAGRFGSTVFVPLEPGNKLKEGALEILGQIAFGGLSAVYLARGRQEKLCVVKEAVVPASADEAARKKAMELFEREAQILMALQHPRIAGVLDYFVENGRHYMLLEYLDGKDLRKFVKEKGPQSEIMVLRWAAEIAEVLNYLHNLKPPIIHRDLTPDNLVLLSDGSVALVDFGAANEFLGTATGTLIGKQSYISPEQFRGKANPASDLYSLGATIYFLLSGQDPEALCQSHPRQLNPFLSEEVDALVADLTALEAAKRPSDAGQVMESCRRLRARMRQDFEKGAGA